MEASSSGMWYCGERERQRERQSSETRHFISLLVSFFLVQSLLAFLFVGWFEGEGEKCPDTPLECTPVARPLGSALPGKCAPGVGTHHGRRAHGEHIGDCCI